MIEQCSCAFQGMSEVNVSLTLLLGTLERRPCIGSQNLKTGHFATQAHLFAAACSDGTAVDVRSRSLGATLVLPSDFIHSVEAFLRFRKPETHYHTRLQDCIARFTAAAAPLGLKVVSPLGAREHAVAAQLAATPDVVAHAVLPTTLCQKHPATCSQLTPMTPR